MALRPLRTIQTSDQTLNLIQDAISETLEPIARHVMLNGMLIKQVNIVAGVNTVNHGLGRNYVSWFAGRFSSKDNLAAISLWETASPDATKFLVLNASAPCVADLLVL